MILLLNLLFRDHYDILYIAENNRRNDAPLVVERNSHAHTYQEHDYRSLQEAFTEEMYFIPGVSHAYPASAPLTTLSVPSTQPYGYPSQQALPASSSPMTSSSSPIHTMAPSITSQASPISPTTAPYIPMNPPTASSHGVYSSTSLFQLVDRSKDMGPIRMVAQTQLPMSSIPIQTRPFKE
jgi:hypothetical protein